MVLCRTPDKFLLFLFGVLTALIWPPPASSAADAPQDWLHWPVDCTMGTDCYIPRYVDHDLSDAVIDFRCTKLTGPRHRGTDIAVLDLPAMEKGVTVRAAAAGRVIALRDGMPDKIITPEERQAIQPVACGNNVALLHDNGYITRYCHMKNGSVLPEKGDIVEVGDPLGLIGLSGDTSFPHLHFGVQKGRNPVHYDPFTDQAMGYVCSPQGATDDMWVETPPYVASGVIKALFYGGTERARADLINHTQHSPVLQGPLKQVHAFFVFYGADVGVTVTRSLTLPDGRTLSVKPHVFTRWQPRSSLSLAYGKRDGSDLPPGDYVALYTATDAKGAALWQHQLTTKIAP